MIIVYYILFPLAMLILGLITSKVASILTLPIAIPISYLYKNKTDDYESQPFRLDFAITSIVHGVMLVFVLKWITNYMDIEIAFWYWVVCFIIKTYSDYLAKWNNHGVPPPISKFIGYVLGFILFVW